VGEAWGDMEWVPAQLSHMHTVTRPGPPTCLSESHLWLAVTHLVLLLLPQQRMMRFNI
jgi:hypothetical protein